jgi:hypothetical protein
MEIVPRQSIHIYGSEQAVTKAKQLIAASLEVCVYRARTHTCYQLINYLVSLLLCRHRCAVL